MKRMRFNATFTMILITGFFLGSPCNLHARKHKESTKQYITTIKQDDNQITAKKTQTYAPISSEKEGAIPASIAQFGLPQKQEPQVPANLLSTIQKELQNPQYRQEILPHNFSYLSQLLKYGSTTKQTAEYAQQVISLFSKLLKGSEYVNSYVFADLVKDMPQLLSHYFGAFQLESSGTLLLASDLDMLERLQKTVSHLVFNKFTQDFDVCKKNPRQFLDDLSNRIVNATTQEVNMELLRQMVIRFLEVGLSKLVWSPRDEEKTWESVKTISHRLATLMEHNIIGDLNDLDELYWSLLHRYRYFIELHSTNMPLSFFNHLKAEITEKKVMLLELEEQETFMQSKASCLLNTVLAEEAKKRIYEYPVEPQVV